MPTEQNARNATLGDLLKLVACITVIVALMYKPVKKAHQERKSQKVQSIINAQTQDSLLKTCEYQEAMRASQALENKKQEIRTYFEQQNKK